MHPRPAAGLILIRPATDNTNASGGAFEVLLTRRSMQLDFAPGAYVFPGGRTDAEDATWGSSITNNSENTPKNTEKITAIREAFEEVRVLLAKDGGGNEITDISSLDQHAPLQPQLDAYNWQPNLDALRWAVSWTTDPLLPIRYCTDFFIARMPADQQPIADGNEQLDPEWFTPHAAMEQYEAGNIDLLFPTVKTLEKLDSYDSIDAVFASCATAPWWQSMPRGAVRDGASIRLMEHEDGYAEVQMRSDYLLQQATAKVGTAKAETKQGAELQNLSIPLDWTSNTPISLHPNLQRLTAPNPSIMTGPGTNTYIIGNAETGYTVIDPGPNIAPHVERLHQLYGGTSENTLKQIICTHSHPDHSPAAQPLIEKNSDNPPIYGIASGEFSKPEWAFTPSHALPTIAADNPRGIHELALDGTGELRDLVSIHTPGHASNHVCLLWREQGILFTGDHILSGTTTVIAHPDGNMQDYLTSLDTLQQLCEEHQVRYLLPAHGYVMGGNTSAVIAIIEHIRAHRLNREAKVLHAMRETQSDDLEDLLPIAYDNVPKVLWPIAKYSLQAHLERIYALQLHKEDARK